MTILKIGFSQSIFIQTRKIPTEELLKVLNMVSDAIWNWLKCSINPKCLQDVTFKSSILKIASKSFFSILYDRLLSCSGNIQFQAFCNIPKASLSKHPAFEPPFRDSRTAWSNESSVRISPWFFILFGPGPVPSGFSLVWVRSERTSG